MEETINPTVLANQLGIRNTLPGEGNGRLLTWEEFWDLVEATYWKNKAKVTA